PGGGREGTPSPRDHPAAHLVLPPPLGPPRAAREGAKPPEGLVALPQRRTRPSGPFLAPSLLARTPELSVFVGAPPAPWAPPPHEWGGHLHRCGRWGPRSWPAHPARPGSAERRQTRPPGRRSPCPTRPRPRPRPP